MSRTFSNQLWLHFQSKHVLEALSADLMPHSIDCLRQGLQNNPQVSWLQLNCGPLQTNFVLRAWTLLVKAMTHVKFLRLHFSAVQSVALSWHKPLVDLVMKECPRIEFWTHFA